MTEEGIVTPEESRDPKQDVDLWSAGKGGDRKMET
jgi:hypothetical protein